MVLVENVTDNGNVEFFVPPNSPHAGRHIATVLPAEGGWRVVPAPSVLWHGLAADFRTKEAAVAHIRHVASSGEAPELE